MSGYYPGGLTDFTPGCPWSEPEIPERDFEVTCSQSLSRTATVTTNNYIPCVDEGCDDGVGYHDELADTSDTNWAEEYHDNDHYTPIQLLGLYKETLKEQLKSWEGMDEIPSAKAQIRRIEHLIEECEGWTEDETEYVEN
jgi:hypothetical protein